MAAATATRLQQRPEAAIAMTMTMMTTTANLTSAGCLLRSQSLQRSQLLLQALRLRAPAPVLAALQPPTDPEEQAHLQEEAGAARLPPLH